MEHYRLCGFTSHNGKDCMADVPKDFPVNLCVNHLMRAGTFYEDMKMLLHASKRRENSSAPSRKAIVFDEIPDEAPENDYTPEAKHQGLVYYIRFQGLIKIGYSTDIHHRMSVLPWEEVLALEPGTFKSEAARHRKFSNHLAAKREWFNDCDEIRTHITVVRERFPHLSRLADRITHEGVRGSTLVPMEEPTIPHMIKTTLKNGLEVIDRENIREVTLPDETNPLVGLRFPAEGKS